jgi:hypothetical protein
MAKIGRESIHYLELFFALVLFMSRIASSSFAFTPFLSFDAMALNASIVLLLIAFVLVYVIFYDNKTPAEKQSMQISHLLHLLFLGIVIAYVCSLIFNPMPLRGPFLFNARMLMIFATFFTALLPVFFLVFMGTYLQRRGNRYAYLLLLAALAIIVLFYNYRFLVTSYIVDDEELLAFHSVMSFVNGENPYTASYTMALHQNPSIGFTVTTDNKLIGIMDYPALFFLTLLPFYFFAQPTLEGFRTTMIPLEASAFIFILIVSLAFVLERKELSRPRITLLAFTVIAMMIVSSINTYLMIAILLIGYVKLESKYSWIVLGLGLAIQEELWLPVLFLIAYSFNNQGLRKGAVNALGAGAVFLAINAYFILQSPTAFFVNVFTALGGFFLPNGTSAIGFVFIKELPLLLSTYPLMFELTTVLLLFLLMYWNRKELIPLFSVVPFIVASRSINSYYATFLFFLLFSLLARTGKETGWIERLLRKNRKATYAIIAAFAFVFLLLISSSHLEYARNFDIGSSSPTLLLDWTNSTSIYRTEIIYGSLISNKLYAYAISLDSDANLNVRGFINDSILDSRKNCGSGDYDCLVNVNEISLPGNSSSYELTARIRWLNSTIPIRHVAIELYNGPYFFSGDAAHNMSSGP